MGMVRKPALVLGGPNSGTPARAQRSWRTTWTCLRRKSTALAQDDTRAYDVSDAGTAALLVAKAHRIGERAREASPRLVDKDAHEVCRILIATDTAQLAADFARLHVGELSRDSTIEAMEFVQRLFAVGPDATGSAMAGRAEEGIGEPATVALQTSILAADLLTAFESKGPDIETESRHLDIWAVARTSSRSGVGSGVAEDPLDRSPFFRYPWKVTFPAAQSTKTPSALDDTIADAWRSASAFNRNVFFLENASGVSQRTW